MSKIVTLTVAAGAYVLGARAGRERYEQIRSGAQRLWADPRVQKGADQPADAVKAHAPQVKDKVVDVAKQAADKAVPGRSGDDGSPS